jgi:hypothetical protein
MRQSLWRIVGVVIMVSFFSAYPQRTYRLFTDAGTNFVEVNPDGGSSSIRIELDGSKFAEYVMALLTSVSSITSPTSGNLSVRRVPSNRPNGNFEGVEFVGPTFYIDILRGVPTPVEPPRIPEVTDVAVQWSQGGGHRGPIFLFPGATPQQLFKFDCAVSEIIQTIFSEPNAWLLISETHSEDFHTFELTHQSHTN